jgi:hypothetical protein
MNKAPVVLVADVSPGIIQNRFHDRSSPLAERRSDHCRTFEEDFLSKIKAVRTYVCDGYVISGNKAFIVYRIDADHAEWGTLNMSEVAIQEWSNGKVAREKFVY